MSTIYYLHALRSCSEHFVVVGIYIVCYYCRAMQYGSKFYASCHSPTTTWHTAVNAPIALYIQHRCSIGCLEGSMRL